MGLIKIVGVVKLELGKLCLVECPLNGYYTDASSYSCLKCNATCSSCTGGTVTK